MFEMTRSFDHVQFRLYDHIARLYAGLKILRVPMTMTPDEMADAVARTINQNIRSGALVLDDEHRVMINVTRGILPSYLAGGVDIPGGTNVIISVYPLRWSVAGMGHLFDTGLNATIPSQRTIPSHLLDPKIKHRSRLHLKVADLQAQAHGVPDSAALMLDPQGYITEGVGANFFTVNKNRLISPRDNNILGGISRHYVMRTLAEQCGLKVFVGEVEPYDVHAADEAFFTATPFCMLPVTSLDGLPIGNGKVGPVFKKLLAQWSKNVGVDIEAQIKRWDNDRNYAGPDTAGR